METYGTKMDRLDLRVVSPDKRIRARIKGRNSFDTKFAGHAYREYTEEAMAAQLAALFQLVWTGYRRADLMAKSETMGEANADESRRPTTIAGRELFDERTRLELTATSPNQAVAAKCVGWRNWKFRIASGVFAAVSEDEFRAEVRALAPLLVAEYHRKLAPLLEEFHRKVDPDGYQHVKDEERMSRQREAAAAAVRG